MHSRIVEIWQFRRATNSHKVRTRVYSHFSPIFPLRDLHSRIIDTISQNSSKKKKNRIPINFHLDQNGRTRNSQHRNPSVQLYSPQFTADTVFSRHVNRKQSENSLSLSLSLSLCLSPFSRKEASILKIEPRRLGAKQLGDK